MLAGICHSWSWIELWFKICRWYYPNCCSFYKNCSWQQINDKKFVKKYGMKINTDKWKVIFHSPINITIENENIKIVAESKFLRCVVPDSSLGLKRRIAMVNSAFGRLRISVCLRSKVKTTTIQRIDTAYCNIWFWNLVLNRTRYQKIEPVWKELSSRNIEHQTAVSYLNN